VVSVRELIDNNGKAISSLEIPAIDYNATQPITPNRDIHPKTSRPHSVGGLEKSYVVPKYSWKVPRMFNTREKKLDYVCLISEESKPFLNLTKIFPR
jgi:hypothetical protein